MTHFAAGEFLQAFAHELHRKEEDGHRASEVQENKDDVSK